MRPLANVESMTRKTRVPLNLTSINGPRVVMAIFAVRSIEDISRPW